MAQSEVRMNLKGPPGKENASGTTPDAVFESDSRDNLRLPDGTSSNFSRDIHAASVIEFEHDRIRTAPENDLVYRPVTPESVSDLTASILEHGILEPLVVTRDGWLISGHRRLVAAREAGLETVPVKVAAVSRRDDKDAFLHLLREANRQRVKSIDEIMREEAISYDPDFAYESLIEFRTQQLRPISGGIKLREQKDRPEISPAKSLLLTAVLKVIFSLKDWWPLSVRQIHYGLLPEPPLIHASKPDSTYRNDKKSYDRGAVDICARGRLDGSIPWEAIADVTRPVITWHTFPNAAEFIRHEMDNLFKGYWRDLMQSQPNHVEIVVEKNTALTPVKNVASRFCIPVTSGRGFSSLPPRRAIAQRFEESGKDRLILLCLSDHDPDGDEISHSFAKSMRDDFGVDNIEAIKVALNYEQVQTMNLPHAPDQLAKEGSSNYTRFVDQYGTDVYELEALRPDQMEAILTKAIDSVIDIKLFNQELAAEKSDAAELLGKAEALRRAMGGTK